MPRSSGPSSIALPVRCHRSGSGPCRVGAGQGKGRCQAEMRAESARATRRTRMSRRRRKTRLLRPEVLERIDRRAGVHAGTRERLCSKPALRVLARREVDHKQAADHRLAVVGQQRPGKGDLLRLGAEVGLVLGAKLHALRQSAGLVDEEEGEEHGCSEKQGTRGRLGSIIVACRRAPRHSRRRWWITRSGTPVNAVASKRSEARTDRLRARTWKHNPRRSVVSSISKAAT